MKIFPRLLSLTLTLGSTLHGQDISAWITTSDRSMLGERSPEQRRFQERKPGLGPVITIDDSMAYQTMDGFGFALTGGSAEHLMAMSADARSQLLHELFEPGPASTGISYLRLTIGASDLNSFVFSYDDLPAGETDPDLQNFDLGPDRLDVIPIMHEILEINPNIPILGSPWSAPAWMKENEEVRGGHLKPKYYPSYAQYFVKYIQEMAREGIRISAITIQNEPLNSRNTPSMPWYLDEQRTFLRDHLIPAFKQAGLETDLVLFDHNTDRSDYPLALLDDPVISDFALGSGFHNYRGDLGAMSVVHRARPDKHLYFTEQMVTEDPTSNEIAIARRVKRMIIGVTRNWSRNVILWNLAADPHNDPHTDNGGCGICQGALTLDGDTVTRNIAYYTIAHASRFVPPGSVRIASTAPGDDTVQLTEDEERPGLIRATLIHETEVLPNVAFRTPDGQIVLIVANDSFYADSLLVQYRGHYVRLPLEPGAVGTFVWAAGE